MVDVLGIAIPPDLLARWRKAFSPVLQPFRTARLGADHTELGRQHEPTLDVCDTFHVYGDGWTWLEESEFNDLSLGVRRTLLFDRPATGRMRDVPVRARGLAAAHRTDSRVVWWPSLLEQVGDHPVLDYVDHGLPPSRHRDVTTATWARAEKLLPGAADLAGQFAPRSGPNCFSNVLAAAGSGGAEWPHQTTIDEWLADHTRAVRGTQHDQLPGVVLVWRNHDGEAEHAAVTVGDGYVLNKPSQGWFSPRLVCTVPETVAASRYRGVRLHRYQICA